MSVRAEDSDRLAGLNWRVIAPKAPPPSRDAVAVLTERIESSDAVVGLALAARNAREPLLVLVNDPHRATLTREALIALFAVLDRRSIQPDFELLFSTGTHRFTKDEQGRFEQATLRDLKPRFQWIGWHDADDAASLVELNEVHLNARIAKRSFLLAIGSVEPHYFAGVTGAHKTLTIGGMARADVVRNHAGALDPASDLLLLNGNPVHDGIVAVLRGLRRAGKRFAAINQVVAEGMLVDAAVGDPLDTARALLPAVRRVYMHELSTPADVLWLRVPPPLNLNLYQADKALKNNHAAVRDGGGIVLEAACPEGVGPNAFLNLLRAAPTYAEARRIVARDGYRFGDHKAVKLRQLTDARAVRIALVSQHVSADDAALAGMRRVEDVAGALEWLRRDMRGPWQVGLRIEDAAMVSVSLAAR